MAVVLIRTKVSSERLFVYLLVFAFTSLIVLECYLARFLVNNGQHRSEDGSPSDSSSSRDIHRQYDVIIPRTPVQLVAEGSDVAQISSELELDIHNFGRSKLGKFDDELAEFLLKRNKFVSENHAVFVYIAQELNKHKPKKAADWSPDKYHPKLDLQEMKVKLDKALIKEEIEETVPRKRFVFRNLNTEVFDFNLTRANLMRIPGYDRQHASSFRLSDDIESFIVECQEMLKSVKETDDVITQKYRYAQFIAQDAMFMTIELL